MRCQCQLSPMLHLAGSGVGSPRSLWGHDFARRGQSPRAPVCGEDLAQPVAGEDTSGGYFHEISFRTVDSTESQDQSSEIHAAMARR
jgi:hypothetical protein